MRRAYKIFIAVGFVTLYGMQVVMAVLLCRPEGIRIHAPISGISLPLEATVAGDAWMKGGVSGITVQVREEASGTTWSVPAQRDTINYKGQAVSVLAAWHAKVTFPSAGRYTLSAVAVSVADGHTRETAARQITADPAARSRQFVFGSPLHIIAIGAYLILCILVPVLVRRSRNPALRDGVGLAIVLFLWVHELVFEIYWFAIGAWTVGNNLLLHMCGLALMFLPFVYFSKEGKFRQYMFEVLYFFGLGGALQALFSPDIGLHGFPELKYFDYFLSHGTIVLGLVYAAAVYRLRIGWMSVVRLSAITLASTIAAWGLNQVFPLFPPYELGNYFAMGYPPPNGSIIDLFATIFGPAPRYLAGLVLMGIAVIAAITAPYWVAWLAKKRRRQT